jgi:pimeloyl-ACP methyl ester carboxylesterase
MKKVILMHILLFVISSLAFAQRTRGGSMPIATNEVATPTPIGGGTVSNEPTSNLVLAPTDKKVFWVHGLTGSTNSWRTTATKYATDRQMREYRPAYVEANGMDVAGHDLGTQIYDKTENDQPSTFENNIGIGHSQGGIVLRALDRENQGNPNTMRFGAYITVGSPNGGAPIIVSANNGMATQLADEIFTELSAGPTSQNIFTQLIGKALNSFKDEIVGFVADGITKQFLATTAQDFAYGSNWINTLNSNNATSNVPRVHIVGLETHLSTGKLYLLTF